MGVAMDAEFVADALLFESERDEERVRIVCGVTPEGEVVIAQRTTGPLTAWCFEEEAHNVEVRIAEAQAPVLLRRLGMEGIDQIPAALQIRFAGYDSALRIREFCREEGVPYEVRERQVCR